MRHQLRLGRSLPLAFLAVLAAVGAILLSGTAGNAATQAAPTNLDPPRITGTAQAGSTLTATEGRWSGNPTDINLQWRRCDENGGSCSNISGAEGQTYVLKTVDVGNTIRVRATAKNADGTGASTSVPTAVVKAATAVRQPHQRGWVRLGGVRPADRTSPPGAERPQPVGTLPPGRPDGGGGARGGHPRRLRTQHVAGEAARARVVGVREVIGQLRRPPARPLS